MRSVTKVRAAAGAVLLVTALVSLSSTPLHAQIDRRPTYDSLRVPGLEVEADSVKTAVLGASLGVAFGSGEALDYTGLGLGLQLSAGYSFGALTELHIGATATSFSDDLADARTTVFGLFAENLYKRRVANYVLHAGIRVGWMWQSRSVFTNTPNGPGIGLFAGGRRPINQRVWLEGNVSFTSISFSGADVANQPDPDQANGTVWGVGLSVVYFMNPER